MGFRSAAGAAGRFCMEAAGSLCILSVIDGGMCAAGDFAVGFQEERMDGKPGE